MDDSTSLRWILIAVGLLVLGLIFVIGNRKYSGSGKSDQDDRLDSFDRDAEELQRLGGTIAIDSGDDAEIDTSSSPAPGQVKAEITVDNFVSLILDADEGESFSGNQILQALTQAGLEYGDRKIFHLLKEGDRTSTVFSVANIIEPGYFEMEGLNELTTPGILFFMQLPQSGGNVQAFDLMLEKAAQINLVLKGALRDSSNSSLTQQTIQHIREQLLKA